MNELSKTCSALDSEITNYLGIWFIENEVGGIIENRRVLIGLEGGKAKVRMAEARGHCSKIHAIYDRNLKRWFKRVFKKNEYLEMEYLFNRLSNADGWIIRLTEQLANWLETRSSQILNLVSTNNYSLANTEIENDRRQLLPLRLQLSNEMLKLFYLQADFIELSGAL